MSSVAESGIEITRHEVHKPNIPNPNWYRVLVGSHAEGGKLYRQGELVNSKFELHKHNSANSIKFERISTSLDELARQGVVPGGIVRSPTMDPNQQQANPMLDQNNPPKPPPTVPPMDSFDSMTVDDLKRFAEAEEIDLGKAKTKAEMIKALRDFAG